MTALGELKSRLAGPAAAEGARYASRQERPLARDTVTSPLRALHLLPRRSGAGRAGRGPRGHGARKTVGELVTCPFCLSMWVATGFTAGLILAPRTTRLVMGTLTALAGADLLQYAHALPEKAAD